MPADLPPWTCNSRRHVFDIDSDGQRAECQCGERVLTPELPPPWAESVAHIVPVSAWTGALDAWGDDIPTDYRASVHDHPWDGCELSWSVDHMGAIKLTAGDLEIEAYADDDDMLAVFAGLVAAVVAFNAKHREVLHAR